MFPSGRKGVKYLCSCDCGNEVWVYRQDLKSGHTKSCGCYRIDKMRQKPGEAGFKQLLYTYKNGAKIRNLEFNLSDECFELLTKGNCFYCGEPPSCKTRNYSKISEHSVYTYNGIDRVDNSIGYIEQNCVTACGICNIAKKDTNYKDFLDWVKKVYQFQENKDV